MFNNTAEEHVDHVREFLTVLKEAGFSFKLKKCKFFAKSVDYLLWPRHSTWATGNRHEEHGSREALQKAYLADGTAVLPGIVQRLPTFWI